MRLADPTWTQLARGHLGARWVPLIYIGFLGILLLAIYHPAWQISPYADDFTVMRAAETGIANGAYAGQYMFRPLELFIVQLSLFLQGNPQLVKVVSLAAFLLSVVLLFWLAVRVRPSDLALPLIATGLFACHSIPVSAVTQIDTVSQQLATLATLAVFGWYLFGPQARPLRYHAVGAGLMLLALTSKEVSVGAVLALPVALALADLLSGSRSLVAVRNRAIIMAATAGVVFAIYMGLRYWAGSILFVDDGLERYTLLENGPANVLKNVVLLLGAVSYMGSTLEVFLLEDPLRIAASVALTIAFNGLAVLGLLATLRDLRAQRAERAELAPVVAAGVMLGASLFPIAITGWPSELHAYLPAPFYALVAAFFALRGWRALRDRLRVTPRVMNRAGIAAFAAGCCWLLLGASEKVAWSAAVGARSQAFYEQLTAWYLEEDAPAESALACLVEDEPGPVYSVFAMSTYSLVQPMVGWLNSLHGPRLVMPATPPAATEDCRVLIEVAGTVLRLRAVDSARPN